MIRKYKPSNNRKSGILQIVFFKPGTFDNEEIKVKPLKPCVVQIKKSKGKVTDMQIADPQNQEKAKAGSRCDNLIIISI